MGIHVFGEKNQIKLFFLPGQVSASEEEKQLEVCVKALSVEVNIFCNFVQFMVDKGRQLNYYQSAGLLMSIVVTLVYIEIT
jgi:hypothetical protein